MLNYEISITNIRNQSWFLIVAGIMGGIYFLVMNWELFWAGGPGTATVRLTLMKIHPGCI